MPLTKEERERIAYENEIEMRVLEIEGYYNKLCDELEERFNAKKEDTEVGKER